MTIDLYTEGKFYENIWDISCIKYWFPYDYYYIILQPSEIKKKAWMSSSH